MQINSSGTFVIYRLLPGFAYDFNTEAIPYDLFIRFIIVETTEEPKYIHINDNQDMRDFIYS
jgi:hypothetical protein